MFDDKEKLELATLQTKRSSIKGQVTKFNNYLNNISQQDSLTSIEINEVDLKLNNFLEITRKFDELQSQIETLNFKELDDELATREVIENNLHHCIAVAQYLVESHKKETKSNASSSPAARTCHSHSCHGGDGEVMGLKLPQIKINKFDGSFYKWLEFRDTYESLIHHNDKLKPIHKYHYLCSYLEGEAARVISNLEISSDNYIEAWHLLYNRYNNKRQLVYNHLNSLFNIEQIHKESDKALRFLSDHITKNLRALKTLGQPVEQWDTLIIFLATTKLDTSTSVKRGEYRNNLDDLPSLDNFKDFLKSRADVLEMLYRSKRDKQTTKPSPHSPQINKAPQHHKQSYNDFQSKSFVISANNNKQPRPCVVCQGKHRIFDCNVFKALTTNEKWAQVSKLKLCHNCLRPDHATAHCRLGGCRPWRPTSLIASEDVEIVDGLKPVNLFPFEQINHATTKSEQDVGWEFLMMKTFLTPR